MSCVERVRQASGLKFVVGPMTIHDLIEVVEIEESSGLSLWGWDSYEVALSLPESITLVARQRRAVHAPRTLIEGFIVARLDASDLHVNNVGVRQESRRMGLGSALLGTALSRGLQIGARTAVLEVRAGNVAAQSLYRRHGFAVCGRRRNYYRQPTEDALIMKADLNSAG